MSGKVFVRVGGTLDTWLNQYVSEQCPTCGRWANVVRIVRTRTYRHCLYCGEYAIQYRRKAQKAG